MGMIETRRWALAAAVVAASTPAFAHDGDHHHNGLMAQLVHLLTQPDHLAFIIVGAITVAVLGMKTSRMAIVEMLRALRKTL